jgi:hypothetical protein
MSGNTKKASDEQLIASYLRTKSIWETAKEFGMCGQSVHERLNKLNMVIDGNGNKWTEADDMRLTLEYELYRYYGKVSRLAESMGRTVFFLSKKAKELGLTSNNYKLFPRSKLKNMSDDAILVAWEDYKQTRFNMSEYCRRNGYDNEAFANLMKERFFSEYDDVIESKLTKCTRYAVGRNFEYRVKKHLESKGYFVMRAPQSKGPVDLLAYHNKECLFVQCKIGNWHQVQPWNEFYEMSVSHVAEPIFCTKKENGKLQFNLITGLKDGSRKANPMKEVTINNGGGLL